MEISLDIQALQREITAIQRGLAEHIPKVFQGSVLTTFGKIRNRIQESGKSDTGALYPKYSENELPTYFFDNKATNAGGRAAIKKSEDEGRGISYEEFKSANNGPASVKYRNLTLSGNMWRDHGITDTLQDKTGLKVIIQGETQSAKDKASWNANQIGDFMKVSQKEEQEATKDFQSEIDQYLKTVK